MVGTGKGAESGILIKGGEALEAAHKLTTVVLDKTGTLTRGEPELTEVIATNGLGEDEVLRLAASAERTSEHPLGEAIVRVRRMRSLPRRGRGVQRHERRWKPWWRATLSASGAGEFLAGSGAGQDRSARRVRSSRVRQDACIRCGGRGARGHSRGGRHSQE